MRNYLIIASAIVLSGSSAAKAADVVRPAQPELPVIAAPVFSWTGLYAGGMIGGAWGVAKSKPACGKGGAFCKKLKPDGFIGGIYAGYNFQTASNMVLGIDADFLWGDVKDSGGYSTAGCGDGPCENSTKKLKLKEEWIGGARLRAGYAFGRLLPYLAGGVSYARLKGSMRDGDNETRGKSKTRTGWNVGVGIDYIPPVLHDHIVLRAEYRYSDFGKKKYDFGDAEKYRIKYNQNDFRVGVAYKF